MYSEHPAISTPPDITRIWRYTSLVKFLHLLSTRTLFFTRLDKLGDPFEGSLPAADSDALNDVAQKLIGADSESYFIRRMRDVVSMLVRQQRMHAAASCWHIGEHESAAMWRLYSLAGGVAIASSVSGLISAVADYTDDEIYIGEVEYLDYATQRGAFSDTGEIVRPLFMKRCSFSHEKELRAIIQRSPENYTLDAPGEITIEDGIDVEVDPQLLIEAVYVSPESPRWVADSIRSLLKKYEMSTEVFHSALDSEPMY